MNVSGQQRVRDHLMPSYWPIIVTGQSKAIIFLYWPFRRVLDPMHVLRFKFKFMPFQAWISCKLPVTGHYCAVGGDAVQGATITDHWQHACTTDICSFFTKVQSIVCGPWKIEQPFIYFLKGELKVESQNFYIRYENISTHETCQWGFMSILVLFYFIQCCPLLLKLVC